MKKQITKAEVTKAVILAGGWGTRLRPLTLTVPKPLVSFCNKPILKYQIEKLVEVGVKQVILALNYFSDKIIEEVKKYESEFDIEIVYSMEDVPLGTAGPLALVAEQLKDSSFFLLNADICCNVRLQEMKDAFMESDCIGSILTYSVKDPSKYGLIETDGNKIISFLEKPTSLKGDGPWLINAGMYIFSSEVLEYIELREMSIEKEVFPMLAEEGKLDSFPFEGYWMDIGQPKDYIMGQKLTLAEMEETKEGLDTENNVVLGKNVKIGSNVKLKNCSIFDNSVVEDNVIIENSIVGWKSHIQGGCRISNYSVLGEGTVVEKNSKLNEEKTLPHTRIGRKNK